MNKINSKINKKDIISQKFFELKKETYVWFYLEPHKKYKGLSSNKRSFNKKSKTLDNKFRKCTQTKKLSINSWPSLRSPSISRQRFRKLLIFGVYENSKARCFWQLSTWLKAKNHLTRTLDLLKYSKNDSRCWRNLSMTRLPVVSSAITICLIKTSTLKKFWITRPTI